MTINGSLISPMTLCFVSYIPCCIKLFTAYRHNDYGAKVANAIHNAKKGVDDY